MIWSIPNILTLLRLFAAPGLAILFLYFARPIADWVALALFIGAAVTDYFDGYLARLWGQESRFGAMIDPIADKAMVIIALLFITGLSGLNPWILLPAVLILFRETFVAGLREFLGATAGLLKVTKLAKWKTTAQMVAIAVLFASGAIEHYYDTQVAGMAPETVDGMLAGTVPDEGLLWKHRAMWASWWAGAALLWVAAVLTVVTGWDYFRKALPYLREPA
ncbi:CDP-diacylglycerol--glycerol-3-phosphate 3-phosphatidyltransferase [Pseudoroseicyclus sp. CXY001]|uniref:CDP-diacylglycerol--glycerol-3-phosphate 3-phosphatidyltransferase n=1 Tax=Pseudoroseicyclus sp. CXY001 TaxID=3242492 RepID=UPI003570A748